VSRAGKLLSELDSLQERKIRPFNQEYVDASWAKKDVEQWSQRDYFDYLKAFAESSKDHKAPTDLIARTEIKKYPELAAWMKKKLGATDPAKHLETDLEHIGGRKYTDKQYVFRPAWMWTDPTVPGVLMVSSSGVYGTEEEAQDKITRRKNSADRRRRKFLGGEVYAVDPDTDIGPAWVANKILKDNPRLVKKFKVDPMLISQLKKHGLKYK